MELTMILFKTLRFSNIFSYGDNNEVNLSANALTQIIGKNGHGKSSIGSILEEVCFNSNSKKIKKAKVLNRYVKSKSYWISLDFEKDGISYNITTNRTTSSGTVVLTRNGVDISSHTATGTYKTIEDVLGYDFKTFSQIVYQSSLSSLEFLTATDTDRKKFLIELLNLSKYTDAGAVFKNQASNLSKQIDIANAKLQTINAWLAKYEKEDLSIRTINLVPVHPQDLLDKVALLKDSLSNIESTNKKIVQNNKYKEILDSIVIDATVGVQPDSSGLISARVELQSIRNKLKHGAAISKQGCEPIKKCPTCSQSVDNSTQYNMVQEFKNQEPELLQKASALETLISTIEAAVAAYTASTEKVKEWEKYHALWDNSLTSKITDRNTLTAEIAEITTKANEIISESLKVTQANKVAEAHNSKVKVLLEQLEDMRTDKLALSEEVDLLSVELSNTQILVKTFSTTGLVAYKIEGLVKDLEDTTNMYLGVLADGRFQISFKIVASDKLNVIITDNGTDIDIEALSTGERARVNVATLLAIRKLMQTLSNSRTNLLILDETVENLDVEGKERLIEVLLEEESLNTFLISHGFSHPLLEKLHVIKENNISRIE